jgi:BirA family transcriptional regulator, biotin operon repressor / biotin---[acetyl-CoA-carboxylase] ligase
MNITLLTFDTLDSTNTEALKQARQGAAEGLCILARQQTAGRGRYGRTWVSEKDAGLYFSIILRPKLETQFLPLITLMAGVAVHDMLQEYGLNPDIKWVNDILVDEKKISGVLAETAESPNGLAVVVGVGVNLTSENFPTEIAGTATSIKKLTGLKVASDEAAETLTKFLTYFYGRLTGPDGPAMIVDEWRKRSTYFSGKAVRVTSERETLTGTTDGLEPNGALRVRRPDGGVTIIQAGEVERLRTEMTA